MIFLGITFTAELSTSLVYNIIFVIDYDYIYIFLFFKIKFSIFSRLCLTQKTQYRYRNSTLIIKKQYRYRTILRIYGIGSDWI